MVSPKEIDSIIIFKEMYSIRRRIKVISINEKNSDYVHLVMCEGTPSYLIVENKVQKNGNITITTYNIYPREFHLSLAGTHRFIYFDYVNPVNGINYTFGLRFKVEANRPDSYLNVLVTKSPSLRG